MKELQKNKKGFTLVELLAVIVILALIMSIAVVSMGGIMQSAREGTFKDTALSIIDGVKTQLSINGQLGNVGDSYYFIQEKLLEKGGHTSPLGGSISYVPDPTLGSDGHLKAKKNVGEESVTNVVKIGSMGVYKLESGTLTCSAKGVPATEGGTAGTSTSYSYVKATYDSTNKTFIYTICLTAGDNNPYIYASEAKLLNTSDNTSTIKGL